MGVVVWCGARLSTRINRGLTISSMRVMRFLCSVVSNIYINRKPLGIFQQNQQGVSALKPVRKP